MKESEKIASFTTGFLGYPLLELLWRGRTHWSMALAGGVALRLLYPICGRRNARGVCLVTAVVITGVELVFGCVFNLILNCKVWDYSKKPMNLWGQICLPYSFLWFLLGVPIKGLCRGIRRFCRDLG